MATPICQQKNFSQIKFAEKESSTRVLASLALLVYCKYAEKLNMYCKFTDNLNVQGGAATLGTPYDYTPASDTVIEYVVSSDSVIGCCHRILSSDTVIGIHSTVLLDFSTNLTTLKPRPNALDFSLYIA